MDVHQHAGPPADGPGERTDAPAIDLSVVYTADVWRNARGGRKRGWRYLDNLDVTLAVDAERALGWEGATIFLYGLYNNGQSLTDELLGDLQTASNIDVGVQAVRLYEAWVEQQLLGGHASVKVGLYDLNSEFDTNDSNSLFINSSHGIGAEFAQSGQNGPSIFPVTSLTLRVDYRLAEKWRVRTAVADGVPGDPSRPKRTAIKLGGDDGGLIVAELEYTDDRTELAFGAWRYTAKYEDILATELAGSSVEYAGNDGFYLLAERRLTGTKERPGLAVWARVGVADEKFNAIQSYFGGGLVFDGLVPGREADKLGLAVASVRLGHPYRRTLELAGETSKVREINVELTYRAAFGPRFTLQPDVQYIINPGASQVYKDALVMGLRMEVGF